MSWILTILGLWFVLSAAAGARFVIKRHGMNAVVATDLLFSCAGIGVLFILLARMVG
ncbi:hypothetical protein [Methylobacterium brachiatum]|uniref:hypothetical protein n=1 Tax=Methylobacterium brachiatum TaxID=269660 RepID=UPI0013CEEE13|nr:hypothetical protein [Methylobacterium brachiatum]